MAKFPHLNNSGYFPDTSNINTYKHNSDFPYDTYDNVQMIITCCKVPWDLGEVHVGQRVVSGIGNVVYFGSKEARTEYFESIPDDEKFVWETKYRSFHDDENVKIPLPFDIATTYNYLYIKYIPAPNESHMLDYETPDGFKEWFLFMRDCVEESPNSTMCRCMRDIWTQCIYDINIPYMILDRGHAPIADTDVETYLANPVENSSMLISEDVNFGDINQIKHVETAIINTGGMLAVFNCSSDITGFKDIDGEEYEGGTPAIVYNPIELLPSTQYVFAVKPDDLDGFLHKVIDRIPHFMQCINAFYLIPEKLITINSEYVWNEFTLYNIEGSEYSEIGSYTFNKSDFAYDDKFSMLAKLYTYPYSSLVIFSDSGTVAELKIQDCSGTVTFECSCNNVIDSLKYIGHVNGINGNTETSVIFNLLDSKHFSASGSWFDTVLEWNIPCYQVQISGYDENRYSTKYTREQMLLAAENEKWIAANNRDLQYQIDINNANTYKTTNDLSNETDYTVTGNNNDTTKKTADLSNETERTITGNNNDTKKTTDTLSAETANTIAKNNNDTKKTIDTLSAETANTIAKNNNDTKKTTDTLSAETESTIKSNNNEVKKTNSKLLNECDYTVAGNNNETTKTVSDRSAKATYDDSNRTATANRTIAYTSAESVLTQHNNSASANRNIQNATAETQYSVTENAVATELSNMASQLAYNQSIASANASYSNNIASYKNTVNTEQLAADNAMTNGSTSAQVEYDETTTAIANSATTQSTTNSVGATIVSAALSGAAGGAAIGSIIPGAGTIAGSIGGAIAGATVGVIKSIIDAKITTDAASASTTAAVGLAESSASIVTTHNSQTAVNQNAYNTEATSLNAQLQTWSQGVANSLQEVTTENSTDCQLENADLIRSNSESCALITYNAETANASTQYNADISNADTRYTCETTNAQNDYDTTLANNADEYDNNETNRTLQYETKDKIIDNTYDTDETNRKLDYNTKISNINTVYNNAETNRKLDYDTKISNINTVYNNAETNRKLDYDTKISNINTVYNNAETNKELNYDCKDSNINSVYDNSETNKELEYETKDSNINTTYDNYITNAKLRYEFETGKIEKEYETAIAAIDNLNKQNALRAPFKFGLVQNNISDSVKPIGLNFAIKTQNKAAIELAGNEFLRYGYRYNSNYEFDGNYNRMKYFTYWKCNDLAIEAPAMPDAYMDTLRMLLLGGVTVWRRPEYIGKVTIYDNIA